MKRIWRLLPYLLVVFALVLPPLFPAGAQDTDWVDQDYPEALKQAKEEGSVNSGGYVSHIKTADISDSQRRIGPPIEGISVPDGAYKNDPEYVQKIYNESALAVVNNANIAILTNPPARTAWAIRDMGQELGLLPKQVYAQTAGIGFAGLAPLLPLWKVFRNIAYLLLALVMIVVGFMIMLRKRIDPKTVVTIQNALPRVVVSLILITFSYAIVGFLVDLMYLAIYLCLALMSTLTSAGLFPDVPRGGGTNAQFYNTNADLYVTGGVFGMVESIMPWDPLKGEGDWGVTELAYDMMGFDPAWQGVAAVVTPILTAIGFAFWPAWIGAAATGFPAIIGLLISLGILFVEIRLLILFVGAYINVILALIVGPVQLLMEAVPGANGFSSWIKNLIANLSVFPVAAVMFMIATVFTMAADQYDGSIWKPPYTLIGGSANGISALFAIGMMMSIPTVCASIKEALKAKAPVNAGPGAIFGPLGAAGGSAMGMVSQGYYMQQMLEHNSQLRDMLGQKKD